MFFTVCGPESWTGRNVFNALFLSAAVTCLRCTRRYIRWGSSLASAQPHTAFPWPLPEDDVPLPGLAVPAVTLSAQVLVLPVLLKQVGEVNLTGLVSNIIVVPLMSLLLLVSLAAQALTPVTDAAVWAGRAGDFIYLAGKWMVARLSSLNGHFSAAAAGPALVAAFCLLPPGPAAL